MRAWMVAAVAILLPLGGCLDSQMRAQQAAVQKAVEEYKAASKACRDKVPTSAHMHMAMAECDIAARDKYLRPIHMQPDLDDTLDAGERMLAAREDDGRIDHEGAKLEWQLLLVHVQTEAMNRAAAREMDNAALLSEMRSVSPVTATCSASGGFASCT